MSVITVNPEESDRQRDDPGLSPEVLLAQRELTAAKDAAESSSEARKGAEVRRDQEHVASSSHRHLPIPLVLAITVGLTVCEWFAAFIAAQAFGQGIVLTYFITAILVIAVVGGAWALAQATWPAKWIWIALQAVVLTVLVALRYRFMAAYVDPFTAMINAVGLSVLTGVIWLLVEEITRRAEPISLWRARAKLKKVSRDHEGNLRKVQQCTSKLQAAEDKARFRVRSGR